MFDQWNRSQCPKLFENSFSFLFSFFFYTVMVRGGYPQNRFDSGMAPLSFFHSSVDLNERVSSVWYFNVYVRIMCELYAI